MKPGGGDARSMSAKADGVTDRRPAGGLYGIGGLLRGDIARLHLAMSGGRQGPSRAVGALARFFVWSEKHGPYRTKIVYCPPLRLLWSFLPDDGSAAMLVHKGYEREVWRERRPWHRAGLLAAIVVLWPTVTLATMAWSTWLNGSVVRRRTGKSRLRQMAEQLRLSALYGVLPPWYYVFDLFDDRRRAKAPLYLHRYETKGGIFRLLKRELAGRNLTPLQDKVRFAERCLAHGVPTVPVLAMAMKGRLVSPDGAEPRLPAIDLFLKPILGRGGKGAERWDCLEPNRYKDTTGRIQTEGELLERLASLSRRSDYLVQPRLVNHPGIADLSNGALCTARIMTCQDERGGFEATNAVFRMAIGSNRTVDNFHAGGIAANVDIASGRLGSATDLGLSAALGWCDRHPDTGATILARALPLWRETIDLVCRAHAAFADRIVIGWDVAICKDGPIVIEGNGAPDVDIMQRISAQPLGETRFAELIAFHLKRALQQRKIAGSATAPT